MPGSESVIFLVCENENVLCERRPYQGELDNCILGGRVEEQDLRTENYIDAAVVREAREEVGIQVKRTSPLGSFSHENRLIHVVLVESWSGEVHSANSDNGNPLVWVPQQELVRGVRLPELKAVLSEAWAN